MSNIIEFKQKKKSDGFKRTDELFTVTLWVGGDDEYEIDMLTNEDYDELDIFIALGCLFMKYGEDNGLIDHPDDE
jgi:hypothetical protein